MLKSNLLVMVPSAGLAVSGAVAPVAAKNSADLKLFLRWEDDVSGNCGDTYLSTEDAPEPATAARSSSRPHRRSWSRPAKMRSRTSGPACPSGAF